MLPHPQRSDVEWQLDPIPMQGTAGASARGSPFPGAVFAPCSGPTDRDWNTPLLPGSNGRARLIAHELARHGFASLRYDKRASGPNAAKNMQDRPRRIVKDATDQSSLDSLGARLLCHPTLDGPGCSNGISRRRIVAGVRGPRHDRDDAPGTRGDRSVGPRESLFTAARNCSDAARRGKSRTHACVTTHWGG